MPSETKTPYAIICRGTDVGVGIIPGCGRVFMTEEEYERQLEAADYSWICPQCGAHPVEFDDENFKAFQEAL